MPVDPLTLMLASAGIQLVGGAISSFADVRATTDAQRRGQFQDLASAEAISSQLEFDISDLRRQGETFKSAQQVSFATSGVETSSGSPLLVLAETAGEIARDESRLRMTAAQQTANLQRQAFEREQAIQQAEVGGTLDFITDALGIGANTALQFSGGGF